MDHSLVVRVVIEKEGNSMEKKARSRFFFCSGKKCEKKSDVGIAANHCFNIGKVKTKKEGKRDLEGKKGKTNVRN